jgi:two-component system, cell cycle response regulator
MSGGERLTLSLVPSVDPLTGVYDRATLLAMLFRETDRAQRMKTALCLLLIGVEIAQDAFPRPSAPIFNELLRQTAERLTRQLRSYDLLGHTDEGEFLAILPGCDAADAASLAERISRCVFSRQFIVGCNAIRLTATFGIALSEGRSPIVVMREAEQALVRAKAFGPESICEFGGHGAMASMAMTGALAIPKNS